MNALIGFSELLSSQVTDIKHKSYLSSIQTAGKTLLTLINDILDLSKIEAGQLEIQSAPTNLIFIFKELEQIFALKIAEKNLNFIIELDNTLPSTLILDETRVRQVLLNLVSNAIKFTEQGHIKLSAQKRDKDNSTIDLILIVEDTGIGIPKNQQKKIFEAFQQQEGQSTRKYGGTGLGLAITKRLVEMMNGQISVHSQQGSVFEIILQDVGIAEQTEEYFEDFHQFSFEPARILLVDDVELNRQFIKEWLLQLNLEVIEAENGQIALLFAEQYKPNLILMDIKMPIMNGYEATSALKNNQSTQDIPIIALSAIPNLTEQSLKAQGFEGYLSKPLTMQAFFSGLSRYLKYTIKEAKPVIAPVTLDSLTYLTPSEMNQLRDKLDNFRLIWNDIHDVLDIAEIEKFSINIKELGKEYNISQLTHYGDNLEKFTQIFDVIHIEKTLNQFPELVKAMEKIEHEKNI